MYHQNPVERPPGGFSTFVDARIPRVSSRAAASNTK
uniref:Bm14474 n=1 Tax=Brugia malayi TaxID=6279 RepID=A0A1U7F1L0_BRUMA|nr:Bm14474 [Brugia malayi]